MLNEAEFDGRFGGGLGMFFLRLEVGISRECRTAGACFRSLLECGTVHEEFWTRFRTLLVDGIISIRRTV
jgi:hypothetical protein